MGSLKNLVFKKADLKMWTYLIVGFFFLVTIGIKAVSGEIDFEFYADSETYHAFLEEGYGLREIVLLFPNMLGPSLILILFNNSFYLVFLFNVIILLFFYYTFANLFDINRNLFLFFIVISPIMFGSVIAINKEIVSLLVLALFFRYYKNRSYLALILALLTSFLVRWQMALFIVSLAALLSPLNPLRNRKFISSVVFLLMVSCMYYLNLARFDAFNRIAEMGADESSEGSGLYSLLIQLQNSNPLGYVLAFIPKTLFLFIGLIGRYYKFFDYSDFYNNVIVFSQSVVNFGTLIIAVKRKVKISNLFFFSAVIYCIIFCLSPIYSPRYLFPAYILLALAICDRKKDNAEASSDSAGQKNIGR
jgi:hypothetical protein